MSKKTIIIIIAVVIIGGGAVYFLTRTTTTPTGETTSILKSFLPFGSNQNTTQGGTSTDTAGGTADTSSEGLSGVSVPSKLVQLTTFPVAGLATFMDSRTSASGGTEQAPALEYVGRTDGHIYEEYLDTKAMSKISSSTIQSTHEALIGNNGKSILYRYLSTDNNTIQSFLGTLGSGTGTFLPDGIDSITMSPDKSRLFYLVPASTGISGYTNSFTNAKRTQVFSSSFSEWNPQWATPSNIFLTTKPSSNVSGSLYSLDVTTQNLTKVVGGLLGLTTLVSPDGKTALISDTGGNGMELRIYSMSKNTFSSLSLATLPEKCVWSSDRVTAFCAVPDSIPDGQYPDQWYQGVTSFDDSIIRINTANNSYGVLIDTPNVASLDATNLTLSPDEKTLFMINKKDSTLWSLDLQ